VGAEGLLLLDTVEYFLPGTREGWSGTGLQPDRALDPGPPPASISGLSLLELERSDAGLRAAFAALDGT
jgi:hypothetical protein